ncbi:hypothetical protein RND71_012529 [Anisodus tanguticus]|uniref:F-box domain-containing protein n=1 Tax=Anisodus tanguticus TaxID=243964 RepID=A0AAE1VH17_9SOLA|nr:hypothetical protein RND71_012529 [Anisodus tanguticus]
MNEVSIMDLPRVIMVEILSRLPIEPIFRCKTVCKCWYNSLTSDPLFVKLYHIISPNFPCILLLLHDSVSLLLELKADYDYHSIPRNKPIMLSITFHLPRLSDLLYDDNDDDPFGLCFVKKNLTLIGLCNGFICLLNGMRHEEDHSICISNPLLGEYFKLKLPQLEKRVCHIVYRFCFSEGSVQYKVLRLITRKFCGRPDLSELEIYTLEELMIISGEMWAKLQVLYGENLAMLMSMVLFIRWMVKIFKKVSAFTPLISGQKK